MSEPTTEQLQSATKIIDALIDMSNDKDEWETIRFVYNMAIEDAINFSKNLALRNIQSRSSLDALALEMEKWLYIPERDNQGRE